MAAEVRERGRAGTSTAQMSGRRKAAVLLAALGPELAASVIAHLREDEVEALSIEMLHLESVAQQTAEAIMIELERSAQEGGAFAAGSELAQAVLSRALGETRATELLERVTSASEQRPFEHLRHTPPERVAAFLQGEAPQTIALVLAHLDAGHAALALARLPEQIRPEVALRIARTGEVAPEVIHQIEELARQRMTAANQQEGFASADGVKALAEILGHSDRATERAVLEYLHSSDQELAEDVRSRLFVFEDIVKLEDRAIQQVLREADQKDLVLAIRGAPEEVKERILANMSERGAEMLKEELEVQQPQRKSDIDAAQSRIVSVVHKLEEAGTIIVPRPEDHAEGDIV
ncbi:MAG TPA: flagellar motor switch protein FliG [Solirubrobacteraceae bacterium]|nr:flagellar motor switch protein FliG [Solirubrobacteraceae bacterium]